jgi:alkaline phosphatase
MFSKCNSIGGVAAGMALALTGAAHAAPTSVAIVPPNGARLLSGQRFDVRVEGKGTGPFSATLAIDGHAESFSSGAQNTLTTDDISSTGFGGFNLRGYSNLRPGVHTITASFTDSTGTLDVSSHFEITSARGSRDPLRNVIIFLGDGMGAAHRTAARLVRYGVTAGDPNGFLEMDGFPATGMVTTHSLNSIVTDSAPGMSGYSTGTHAQQYLDESDAEGSGDFGTGLKVLLGGGRRWALPATEFGSSRAVASDYAGLPADLVAAWGLPAGADGAVDPERDLLGDFVSAGYQYVDSGSSLNDVLSAHRPPDKLLGLFAYGNMNVALDKLAKRRNVLLPGTSTFVVDDYHAPDQPMLDEMTRAALRVLHRRNDNGFVLMVEGAHIDKQSHAMDAERAVYDTLEFDRAVGVARDFAEHTDRETVIIVLADHECAGFSIIGALSGGVAAAAALASDGTVLDPATQPARQKLVGTYDAAGFPQYTILPDGYPESMEIDGKLLFGFGASGDRYETWLQRPRPLVDSLLPTGIRTELSAAGYSGQPFNRAQSEGFFLRGQAVGQDQAVHTASDIPISAYSPRAAVARQFVGVQRNTDVFVKLMRAVLGGY